MSNDLFDPHFDCFPPPKPTKEIELFYLLIYLFFLQPLIQVDEFDRLSIVVVTKTFLGYCVVLEIRLFVLGFYSLVVDYLELVNVVL